MYEASFNSKAYCRGITRSREPCKRLLPRRGGRCKQHQKPFPRTPLVKRCARCGERKPLCDFHASQANIPTRRQSYCKSCQREYNTAWKRWYYGIKPEAWRKQIATNHQI
jgi:hypothetical protein